MDQFKRIFIKAVSNKCPWIRNSDSINKATKGLEQDNITKNFLSEELRI
jgi:hypothetical protein